MEDVKVLIDRVEKLIELDAVAELHEFINDSNISDIAELINEMPEHTLRFSIN